MFVKTGSWLNLYELESQLTLNELFLLYRACANETSMNMKIAAAAQGADVDFDDDWYDPAPVQPKKPASAMEMKSKGISGFGMGATTDEDRRQAFPELYADK